MIVGFFWVSFSCLKYTAERKREKRESWDIYGQNSLFQRESGLNRVERGWGHGKKQSSHDVSRALKICTLHCGQTLTQNQYNDQCKILAIFYFILTPFTLEGAPFCTFLYFTLLTLIAHHHFCSVGPILANEIPLTDSKFTDYVLPLPHVFSLTKTCNDIVLKLIQSLPLNKASGHDGFSP